MARACLVLFFVSFIVACDFTNGFLTRGRNLEAVFTKDTPVPEDVVEKLAVESVPVEVTVNKQCAKIGEFCANHSDCCTNACLGYMKRCVS
ncbi:conotoxin ArMKLT2-0111-like [Pararge aegeria]|uniref:conotoxin ArMKLT2-0111-like n=1 Tax=Pararge aegeria TaxID=116150 RepID=UPI0019D254B1|nr:conotoxin ArMKLT2-0111-like [Pararge aegeria]